MKYAEACYSRRLRAGAALLLIIFLCSAVCCSAPAARVRAEAAAVPQEAYAFYCLYGGGRMIMDGESLLFCTRGKLKSGSGLAYRTLGYTIRLRTERAEYRICAVIGGSICRISRETRNENGLQYEYTLFRFDADALYKRLRLAYPKENFRYIFETGRQNLLMLDAMMTLVQNGVPLGSAEETDDGQAALTGTVCLSEAEIRGAAAWGPGNDFTSEFGIVLRLTMQHDSPPLLVRHIAEEYLAYLPEGSFWQTAGLRGELESSLCADEPLAEWSLTGTEYRGFLESLSPEMSPEAVNEALRNRFLSGTALP